MPLHPRIQSVTDSIIARSAPTRSAYLAQVDAMAQRPPGAQRMGCANVAHAFAAMEPADKRRASALDKVQVVGQRAPNIAIINAYNDMLSAHAPLQHYPAIIKHEARQWGATAQVAGGVPAMCDGVTQGTAGMELSLFSRDAIAMATAVSLSHDMFDCALMLGVMAGGDFAGGLTKGLKGLRIGYVRHFHEIDQPADPEMAAALDEAARVMVAEGAIITDISLPPLQQFAAVNRTILYGEAGAIHEHWLKNSPEKYAGVTRRRLLPSQFVSAADYVQAQRRRGEMVAAVQEAFTQVDLLLTASSMDPACRIDDTPTVERTYPRQARTPFNVTGHPAVTIMNGLHSTGLPLSLQLVAPAFEEALLLQAAAGYERAAPWKDMAPNP
jgi:hypothetical protein